MVEKTKTTTISFKVSSNTINKVNDLCCIYGVNKSKLIRTLIETEHDKITKFKKIAEKIDKK